MARRRRREEEEEHEGSRRRGSRSKKPHEEEEEEDEYLKHKRSRVSDFFDLEAEDDDDGDEESDEENEVDDFIDHGTDLPEEDVSTMHSRRPSFLQHDRDKEEDIEELEQRIHDRFESYYVEDEEEITEVEQQALLPSVKDPKLWLVKCAIGRERELAVCLMQKFIDQKESELQIMSVVSLDHLKGFIYVEANKEAHVKEACKGFSSIYSAKVVLVPIKEMDDVLSVESKEKELLVNTWVRLKSGTYKGDLAKVLDVDDVRRKVTVKLVPRIDLKSIAKKLEALEIVKKKTLPPPPRLMNVEEARDMHIRVQRVKNQNFGCYFEKIDGILFKDGFLIKTVSMKSISSQNILPTVDEVEFWNSEGEDDGIASLFAKRKEGHFIKGDAVLVVKGDLQNLIGWVEKVEEEVVYVRSKGLPDSIAVKNEDLCKYFQPGVHVKVVSGAQQGVTGMVVEVKGHILDILTDTAKEGIHVFADDVVESSEVTSSSILPNIAQFRGKQMRGRAPTSSARRGQDSLVGATVKIRVGSFKGLRGRVKDVNGKAVRVELESQMKIVTVLRDQIAQFTAPGRGLGSETPMHPSQTPLHPYSTPMRDRAWIPVSTPVREHGTTPVHDGHDRAWVPGSTPVRERGNTPVHDGMRTPMHDRAWVPMRTMPVHDGITTPVHDGLRTPSHHRAWTPVSSPMAYTGLSSTSVI